MPIATFTTIEECTAARNIEVAFEGFLPVIILIIILIKTYVVL